MTSDGGVSGYGDATDHGSVPAGHLNRPMAVGMPPPRDGAQLLAGGFGRGRLLLRGHDVPRLDRGHPPQPARGGYGRHPRRGRSRWWHRTGASSPSATPGSTVRPGASTSTGPWWVWPPPTTGAASGWWHRIGGVFSFGDARFYGSTGALTLAAPITSLAATPDGNGYLLIAVDGGVFSFGDSRYEGNATSDLHPPDYAESFSSAPVPHGRRPLSRHRSPGECRRAGSGC